MLNNKGKGNMRSKPADRKQVEINTKDGKASNRRGTRYGSREAGKAPEHFEQKHKGEAQTSRSAKVYADTKQPRKKTMRERRIVSG